MIPKNCLDRLKEARRIVVFTGAGVSKESGISTFRDAHGLWAKFNPEEVATPAAFQKNPQFVWDWYVERADAIRAAEPNAAHLTIARLSDVVEVTVITQNVDNLHQLAGSRIVHELHGNIFRLKPFVDEDAAFADGKNPIVCHVCNGYADPDTVDSYASKEDIEGLALVAGPVPRCPACGSLFRPGVTWFNEMLDPYVLDAAFNAVDACDALICVGSSLEVQPAAGMPYRALQNDAVVIEVNPEPTGLTERATASLQGSAAEILPKLIQTVWGLK